MRGFSRLVPCATGGQAPALGALRPTALLLGALVSLASAACGDQEKTRTLEPVQLGMTSTLGAIYADDEIEIYEVKKPVRFPIRNPTAAEIQNLAAKPVPPYGRMPFLLEKDIKVQITWTVSNLDEDSHNVEILIDPWNEFGRYYPGMAVTNVQREEQMPNFSGIQLFREIPGTKDARSSRLHGTFNFEDMKELAIDFATVMNVIANAPPPDPSGAQENPAISLANRAFNIENRSYEDVVMQPFIPQYIAGLTGIDLGLRTYEPANVAIEIVVEVVDTGTERVITDRDSGQPVMPEQTNFVTPGGGAYGN